MERYRSYNRYLKDLFGERVQKISLDAGLGCPNRDGTLSQEGCLFCDGRGSGTGAFMENDLRLAQQIACSKRFLQRRYGAKKFIAYFQSFTNTYAPVDTLKRLYDQALNHPDMVGLSVGTRPDCVDRDKLDLLASYKKKHLVWIEYGLQSAHDVTLKRMNRGHNTAAFERSVYLAGEFDLNICAHIILGLPHETREMMMETARFVASLPIHGIKIHLLYVTGNMPLADLYGRGEFQCLSRDAYVNLAVDFLEYLPPEMVVQRLTGDPPVSELMAPEWAAEKNLNLRRIHEELERRNTWQGRKYRKYTAPVSKQEP